MGTNFYVWNDVRDGWHLGKRSAGWPFLLHAQDDWPQEQAMGRWLQTLVDVQDGPGGAPIAVEVRIEDEYGGRYTFNHFIQMVLKTYADSDRVHQDAFVSGGFQFVRGEFC